MLEHRLHVAQGAQPADVGAAVGAAVQVVAHILKLHGVQAQEPGVHLGGGFGAVQPGGGQHLPMLWIAHRNLDLVKAPAGARHEPAGHARLDGLEFADVGAGALHRLELVARCHGHARAAAQVAVALGYPLHHRQARALAQQGVLLIVVDEMEVLPLKIQTEHAHGLLVRVEVAKEALPVVEPAQQDEQAGVVQVGALPIGVGLAEAHIVQADGGAVESFEVAPDLVRRREQALSRLVRGFI